METTIPVPGIEFEVTEERKHDIISKLKEGMIVELAPEWFGKGYYLSTTDCRSCQRALKETAEFFEVPELFIDAFEVN